MRAATGVQYELTAATPSGPATAIITEVAAGLRAYAVNGIDLVETFPAESQPPMGAGIVLVPWPNRIRDGVWVHDGVTRQLALTEPARHNAIHGLLRFSPYREVSRTASSVTLAATVFPQSGYPFQLDTEVTYALAADGLEVTHLVRNVGRADAPVALGAHPYLQIGGVPTGDLVLHLAAGTHLDVDDRLNPVGETPVDGTGFDLRAGKRVDELDLDDGFGSVTVTGGLDELDHRTRSTTGHARPPVGQHSLTAPDGRSVILWGDENMRYVQVYTPRDFPIRTVEGVQVRGQAVAIEPMTAPADAFNSGAGLRWLAPGEAWTVRWGIRHLGLGA